MPGSDHLSLLTTDGVRIAAEHRPPDPGSDRVVPGLVVIVAHGFSLHRDRPAVRRVGTAFEQVGGVVLLDHRGHGRSGGHSTLGDREALDVDAAVRWSRRRGYPLVATVGFSMGGAAVIRQAGLFGDVDAVVSVSAVSRWFVRETVRLRLLSVAVRSRPTRLATRVALGARLTSRYSDVGEEPRAVVGDIAPTPLLLVHGDRDPWFGPDHARALSVAAGAATDVWVLPDFGHAEEAMTTELTGLLVEWVVAAVRGEAHPRPPAAVGCGTIAP